MPLDSGELDQQSGAAVSDDIPAPPPAPPPTPILTHQNTPKSSKAPAVHPELDLEALDVIESHSDKQEVEVVPGAHPTSSPPPKKSLARRITSRSKDEAGNDRVVVLGSARHDLVDNAVYTSKYTALTFLPTALREQFRRVANVYFLLMGLLMAGGYYTNLYDSAISPWTTLGPLGIVVSISLIQEGFADVARHKADRVTNTFPCHVLRPGSDNEDNSEDGEKDEGYTISIQNNSNPEDPQNVHIQMKRVCRMNIRAGDIVVCKNRDMIPADLVLLASSADQGSAYIETSSIDGETNLKLRLCSKWNEDKLKSPSGDSETSILGEERESFEDALSRILKFSSIVYPIGKAASTLSTAPKSDDDRDGGSSEQLRESLTRMLQDGGTEMNSANNHGILTFETPNASVNTFNGKLTLPGPVTTPTSRVTVPLNADNILLRGAVLRNTEWIIGIAAYTGKDTKLVQNSFATPSKFSRLDGLANRTVIFILFIMALTTAGLAGGSVITNSEKSTTYWYLGYLTSDSPINDGSSTKWPYLSDLESPKWNENTDNFLQSWLLFFTLLNNFVPLSLYITLEVLTYCLMYFIGNDEEMYHKATDTPAVARSTNVSDLGQVQYVFSDKTGTLTQNIMRFKRASVDGMVFGAPALKTKGNDVTPFHPLRALLVGSVDVNKNVDSSNISSSDEGGKNLTFNAEMFLRVMSLCHTVVVEKNYETAPMGFGYQPDEQAEDASVAPGGRARLGTADLFDPSQTGSDGAPIGFGYQAESPDEGALVTAASSIYSFQLVSRTSAGVTVRIERPSIFSDKSVVEDIKNGSMSVIDLAARTSLPQRERLRTTSTTDVRLEDTSDNEKVAFVADNLAEAVSEPRLETWQILCVNKFDSDRKRMSVLVRSPPELGSLPMLLCKGADSAMLNSDVCASASFLIGTGNDAKDDIDMAHISPINEDAVHNSAGDDWELGAMLGVQSHLGEFASEGLRTLVLGARILNEDETEQFTSMYTEAASSLVGRNKKLKDAAYAMESNLHIVGATAIEDKLQTGVPSTIANLERAGIKLWVLTGDKRETAVEIGYSTKVLTPKMHLSVVKDAPSLEVKAKLAMEFIRLVKFGKLPDYTLKGLSEHSTGYKERITIFLSTLKEKIAWIWQCMFILPILTFGCKTSAMEGTEEDVKQKSSVIKDVGARRNAVRDFAFELVAKYLNSGEKKVKRTENANRSPTKDGKDADVDDAPPFVYQRANTAKDLIEKGKTDRLSGNHIRNASLASVTSMSLDLDTLSHSSPPIVDEDALSLLSFLPHETDEARMFDKRKRTILERLFAVDRDVRKGRLNKHKASDFVPLEATSGLNTQDMSGPRALIIEGAALLHFLGDPLLEEMLFAVASCCDAVIACRVSPKQKALLVKMVRNYVVPEPVTLAIGDGANDVGMIQEAHIGIGISGLEGQQAVNASDFAIAQFRFLQELLLVHGRWNFMRMSKVTLYSFYKNAVLAGILSLFAQKTLYSGTALFDQYVVSMLNFVASFPILFTGIFDRDLGKKYARENPSVYAPGPNNEYLSFRMILRWAFITFCHILSIYWLSAPALYLPGGVSSSFKGLMANGSRVGDGEGGDLKVFGTTIYLVLILVLAYKCLYETRSLVHGNFPPCFCRKKFGVDTWPSRLPYTWVGVIAGSFGFFIFAIYMYEIVAANEDFLDFIPYVGAATHTLNTRSITWLVIFLAPIGATIVDVTFKVFSNMYYPQQVQIHMEIEAQQREKDASTKKSVRLQPVYEWES